MFILLKHTAVYEFYSMVFIFFVKVFNLSSVNLIYFVSDYLYANLSGN